MSMTMSGVRQEKGAVPVDKLLRRHQNLLNMVYLQAEALDDGGFRIPRKTLKLIQTELDFSLPDEKTKKKREEAIKKRYRQRGSYGFWKEALDLANISNHVDAKEFLMKLYSKYDSHQLYGSMTHSFYALETLQLAIDDTYGTNELILEQYKRNLPPKKTKAKSKKKPTKSVNGKVQKTPPLSAAQKSALHALVPF